jgi:hypothetical protein
MPQPAAADGIRAPVPRSRMSESVRRMWDAHSIVPGASFYQTEFGFYSLDAWKEQGMPEDVPQAELFGYDAPAVHSLGQLGWCEAGFSPDFEVKLIEARGEHEVEQDHAGRRVLYFKGRRSGFMPEYLDHPVKGMRTWQENVKWRMDPATPARYTDLDKRMADAKSRAAEGMMITQNVIGGYMYLRSLIGPANVLYAFYDMPDVIHDCMTTWFELADAVSARHQQYVTIDKLFFGEDICYNHGPLISPDMMREFLLPYYQQLITNIKQRQIDRTRHLFFEIDTDGYANPTIPIYRELGMDVMSPFEVASGCDVVEVGKQYPDLVLRGGIDKRVLAAGRGAIDAHLEYIYPAMRARGGYIPTCDHGVPAEVPYQDYLYFRQRALELGA